MSDSTSYVNGRNSGLDGDKTTTGATCIAGPGSRWTVDGRRKLYVGDKTTRCPKCGETGVIVSGDPHQTNPDGRAVVVDRSPVLCKCPANHVIAGSGSARSKPAVTRTQPEQKPQDRNTIRFKCTDDSGQLMGDCQYILFFPDGQSEEGNTDSQGFTAWHFADSPENISLHVLGD